MSATKTYSDLSSMAAAIAFPVLVGVIGVLAWRSWNRWEQTDRDIAMARASADAETKAFEENVKAARDRRHQLKLACIKRGGEPVVAFDPDVVCFTKESVLP